MTRVVRQPTARRSARADRREAIDDTGEANARRGGIRRSIAAGRPIGRIGQQSSEGSEGNRDVSVGRVDGVHDTTPSWESESNQQKKQISRACDAEAQTAEGIERRRRFAAALRLRIALTARAIVRAFVSATVRARGGADTASAWRRRGNGRGCGGRCWRRFNDHLHTSH